MTAILELRGVPKALARDMWWLADTGEVPGAPASGRGSLWGERGEPAWSGRLAVLAGLTVLADFLFYGQTVGLSLALFAVALLVGVMLSGPASARLGPALLLTATALPVVEHVQALSLAFLAVGTVVSLAWATAPQGSGAVTERAADLLRGLPVRGVVDGIGAGRQLQEVVDLRASGRQMRSWLFPLGGALVLTGLLMAANPILAQNLGRLFDLPMDGALVGRGMFWMGAALLIWPLIAPARPSRARPAGAMPRLPGPSAASVARSLVLFNLILGVQTVLDAVYLWGGAGLPKGVSAAGYAHRGAYPLLVTALLAGAFALAARPFARENRSLRFLLLVWLGQNVALTVSAMMRLDLYVEAFGLTYLRLHAAIWMGLVAAGLGLTAWQVWRGLQNRWLVVRTFALVVGTLYACCFVNFAGVIASVNLQRDHFDGTYICRLGPTAAAAVAASGREVHWTGPYGDTLDPCLITAPRIDGWREWGFRNWRVRRYLDGLAEGQGEDTRRG